MDLANAYLGLRAELASICERLEEAESAAWSARVHRESGQVAAAEAEIAGIEGVYEAASQALADLLLLLLRHALAQQPDVLRSRLAAVLAPELDALADDIVRIERRRS